MFVALDPLLVTRKRLPDVCLMTPKPARPCCATPARPRTRQVSFTVRPARINTSRFTTFLCSPIIIACMKTESLLAGSDFGVGAEGLLGSSRHLPWPGVGKLLRIPLWNARWLLPAVESAVPLKDLVAGNTIRCQAVHGRQLVVVLRIHVGTVLNQDHDLGRSVSAATHPTHVKRPGPSSHDQVGQLSPLLLVVNGSKETLKFGGIPSLDHTCNVCIASIRRIQLRKVQVRTRGVHRVVSRGAQIVLRPLVSNLDSARIVSFHNTSIYTCAYYIHGEIPSDLERRVVRNGLFVPLHHFIAR